MPATPAFIEFATKQYRFAEAPATGAESQAVKDKFPLADDLVINTFIDVLADGQALADEVFAFLKDGRQFYSFQMQHSSFEFEEGDIVTFTFPRFGLAAGVPYFVAKIGEASATGITSIRLFG